MNATGTKRRTKNEASLLKRYESSVTSQKPPRTPKESKKSPDKKNPRDVSIDAVAVRDLGVTSNTERDTDAPTKRRREDTLAVQLMPTRDAQTRETLDIRANRTPQAPRSEEAEPSYMTELIRVNRANYDKRNNTFSLQDLVGLGMLTPHAMPVGLKRVHVARQMHKDVDFMRRQIEQLVRDRTSPASATTSSTSTSTQPANTMVVAKSVAAPDNGLTPTGATGAIKSGKNVSGKPAQVKMSLLFGSINYAFGYEKRASSDHRDFVAREWDRDREQRRRQFFLGDALEPDVEFQSSPMRFKLFRQLREANLARFRARMTLHADASAMVPRTDLETVNRRYVTNARRRPKETDQKCFRGTRCCGYMVGRDPSLWYTMKAFYTQLEQYRGVYKPEALCVDCYLHTWTLQCMDNIANEREQKLPLNHFTVMVGEGEYGQSHMLPVKFNRLETGIVGCVPHYHAEQRQMKMSSVTVERGVSSTSASSDGAARKRRKVDTDTESYIAETGVLDF